MPRDARRLEHHRTLTDYTATMTDAVTGEEAARISIVDSNVKESKPRPILKSSQDNSDNEAVTFMNKDAPSEF